MAGTSKDIRSRTMPAQRSSAVKIWRENQENGSTVTCARVIKIAELKKASTWEELSEVNDLAIQDDDKLLIDVPKEIGKMARLTTLRFTWGKIKKIPKILFSMKLRRLQLERNNLIEIDPKIKLSESLVYLDVSFNNLQRLPREIGSLPNLALLNVSANSLKELPDTLGALLSLTELNVGSNNIQSLPESIGQIKTLKCLDISCNNIPQFPDAVGDLTKLVDIRASKNHLVSLPDSFHKLGSLRSLIISGNKMTSIPRCLEGCGNLGTLNARDNDLSSMKASLKRATTILLDKNSFVVIPNKILESRHIEMLSMEDNFIKDIDRRISLLTKLRALHMGGNPIGRIPGEMCNLVQLRHLSLRSAKVYSLPDDFVNLTCLTTLDLNENPLEDQLSIAYRRGVPGIMEHIKMAKEFRKESEPAKEEEDDNQDDYQSHDSDSEAGLDPVTDDSGSEIFGEDDDEVIEEGTTAKDDPKVERAEGTKRPDVTKTIESSERDSGFSASDRASDIMPQSPNFPIVDITKGQKPEHAQNKSVRPKSESHIDILRNQKSLAFPSDQANDQKDSKLAKIEEREEVLAAAGTRESYQPIDLNWSGNQQGLMTSPPLNTGARPSLKKDKVSRDSDATNFEDKTRLSRRVSADCNISTPSGAGRAEGGSWIEAKTGPSDPLGRESGAVPKRPAKPAVPPKKFAVKPKSEANYSSGVSTEVPIERSANNRISRTSSESQSPRGNETPTDTRGATGHALFEAQRQKNTRPNSQAETDNTTALPGDRRTTPVSSMVQRFQTAGVAQGDQKLPRPRVAKSTPNPGSVNVVMRESVFPPAR